MSQHLSDEQRLKVEEFRARHKTGVLTLLFTDMVGSTDLKRDLGDVGGSYLIQLQQQVIREHLAQFSEAEEIGTAGDSFFVTFIRPSDAVRFSLLVHQHLRHSSQTTPRPVALRIGIHMGEVFIDTRPQADRKRDILGIQVDMAHRLMMLGVGGQTLVTRSVFDNARAVLRGMDLEKLRPLVWLNHGFYRAQGVEEPFEVCETGEEGVAPLAPPPNTRKTQRFIIPDFEPVIGWHPALEVEIPSAPGWVLDRKVGEGGFGEVWNAYNRNLREERIFKFCFRADRVRSLKREVALFRILREQVGEHPHVVRIHDVYFEAPPYYIVMDHFDALDLKQWWEKYEGEKNIPMEVRLEIVAQVGQGLYAAHQAGVIHRDVKPSNILVAGTPDKPESIFVKLTDFGIGQVYLDQIPKGLMTDGLTEILGQTELSSRTGTRVYMSPEVLAGRQSTVQSDVYSLGVVLFQLVVADLSQPVTTDWQEMVSDPLLVTDIAGCFAGNPAGRYATARELVDRLVALPQRREEYHQQQAQQAAAEALARKAAEEELLRTRQNDYQTCLKEIHQALTRNQYDEARQALCCAPPELRHWEWGRLAYLCHLDQATLAGYPGPVCTIAWNPLQDLIAGGGDDGTLLLWNPGNGELVGRCEHLEARIDALAFSPDGDFLAVGDADGWVRLWSIAEQKWVWSKQCHQNLVDSLAFSPEGQFLASGSWDKQAAIWETATGRGIARTSLRSPAKVSFQSDGRCVALGCWDHQAVLWDIEQQRELVRLEGRFPVFGIFSAVFAPDGDLLAIGNQDGSAGIWDTRTGQLKTKIKGHLEALYDLAFTPDGGTLITVSNDRTVRSWNTANGQPGHTLLGHGDAIRCVAVSPDASRLASGGLDRTIRIWNPEGCPTHFSLCAHSSYLWSVVFSPDGRYLATSSGEEVWGTGADNSIRLWDFQTRQPLATLSGHTSNVWSVMFSPDGQQLVSGSADQTVRVWQIPTGEEVACLEGHTGFVMDVAFHPQGHQLASCSRDGTIRLWSADDYQQQALLDRHSEPVVAIAYHGDGEVLASASWDQTIKLWDTTSGQELTTLGGHQGSVEDLAFSPDGQWLASTGKDLTIRIWDWRRGTTEQICEIDRVHAASVAFSPDGQRLVVACGDNQIRILDPRNGRCLLTMPGHRWFAVSACFSPDGGWVASASSDTTAILWPTFPWDQQAYDEGGDQLTLAEQLERYKRRIRSGQNAHKS